MPLLRNKGFHFGRSSLSMRKKSHGTRNTSNDEGSPTSATSASPKSKSGSATPAEAEDLSQPHPAEHTNKSTSRGLSAPRNKEWNMLRGRSGSFHTPTHAMNENSTSQDLIPVPSSTPLERQSEEHVSQLSNQIFPSSTHAPTSEDHILPSTLEGTLDPHSSCDSFEMC